MPSLTWPAVFLFLPTIMKERKCGLAMLDINYAMAAILRQKNLNWAANGAAIHLPYFAHTVFCYLS